MSVAYLGETCEIQCEERSIYKDIREINIAYIMIEEGVTHQDAVEILEDDPESATIRYKKKNGYYVARRPLDVSDARLIVECLHTARFVSERDTKFISKNIGSFLSDHQREEIEHDTFAVARVKTNNKDLFDTVDIIHSAMKENRGGKWHDPEKIRFKYLKCTIQNTSQKVARRRGEDYVVSPHAIMINEGNYYLLGIDDKKKKLRTYRLDRMKNVELTGEIREVNADTKNLKNYLENYSQRVFSMYGGELKEVRIRFTNDLLDTVVDRFGSYALYMSCDERHFVIKVSVEVSKTFFGWLCGFGKKAKLISPDDVVGKFKLHLDNMQELYK